MDISMNTIDSITLSYFTNRSQYEQLLNRTLNQSSDIEYAKEKRFYKKRILDLNKKLFRNEIDDKHMANHFNMYIKGCIEYLKMIDTNDLMQKQYQDTSNNDTKCIDLDTFTDLSNVLISDENVMYCDYLMTNNDSTKKINLDTYVVKTSTSKKQKILPKKQDVNIKTREHKTKGIKPKGIIKTKEDKTHGNGKNILEKKKNITNNYDEDTKE
jgi:hypothetical protein